MNEQKQPGIKFYGIFIIEESFSRKPNVPLDAEEDLEMSSELSVQGKKMLQLWLKLYLN